MTVQTAVGSVTLDAGDFQHTHKGVTWGLKVRFVPAIDGMVLDVVIAERGETGWLYKAAAMQDSEGKLDRDGLPAYLAAMCANVNAWLKARFSGTEIPPQINVPAKIAALDKAVGGLIVSIVDGTPVVRPSGS